MALDANICHALRIWACLDGDRMRLLMWTARIYHQVSHASHGMRLRGLTGCIPYREGINGGSGPFMPWKCCATT